MDDRDRPVRLGFGKALDEIVERRTLAVQAAILLTGGGGPPFGGARYCVVERATGRGLDETEVVALLMEARPEALRALCGALGRLSSAGLAGPVEVRVGDLLLPYSDHLWDQLCTMHDACITMHQRLDALLAGEVEDVVARLAALGSSRLLTGPSGEGGS